MLILKTIKSHFKGIYDKQNLTLVVISYEIYETRRRLLSKSLYEMTTGVRSSIYCLYGLLLHGKIGNPSINTILH